MKEDFSVCNNGLRENQKTKITNLGIGLTAKLKNNALSIFFF